MAGGWYSDEYIYVAVCFNVRKAPVETEYTDGKLNLAIDLFAHVAELQVLKYLPSFP